MAKKNLLELVDFFTGEVTEGPFQSAWKGKVENESEIPEKGNITETAYIPPQVQIADFMDAGTRLALERKARFDNIQLNLPDDADIPLDPTREPGADIVDVQRAAYKANERIAVARKNAQEKVVEQSKKAEDTRINAAVAAALASAKEAGIGK